MAETSPASKSSAAENVDESNNQAVRHHSSLSLSFNSWREIDLGFLNSCAGYIGANL